MGRTTKVLVFFACSLAIAAVHREVYKWVDDQGKVHYSDAPPRGTVSKKVDLPVTTPQQRENAQQSLEEPFWTGGRDHYQSAAHPECVMAFPAPAGIMTGSRIIVSRARRVGHRFR